MLPLSPIGSIKSEIHDQSNASSDLSAIFTDSRSESYGVSPKIPPVSGKRDATQPPPSGPHPSNLATAHLS